MKKKMQKKTKKNRENHVSTLDYVSEIRDSKTAIHRRQQDDNDSETDEYNPRKPRNDSRCEEIQSTKRATTTKHREITKKKNLFRRDQQTQKDERAWISRENDFVDRDNDVIAIIFKLTEISRQKKW